MKLFMVELIWCMMGTIDGAAKIEIVKNSKYRYFVPLTSFFLTIAPLFFFFSCKQAVTPGTTTSSSVLP